MGTGRLVILSGPSGVGKDTVINAWKKADPRVERVVARTTRDPRIHEIPDVDYVFIDREEFERLVAEGFFEEHKRVYDNYYGTPKLDMEKLLQEGKVAVLKIDVEGAQDVMALRPDATTIFLHAPDDVELERRIRGRKTDTEEMIQKRLANAHAEIAKSHLYQHQIVNDKIEIAVRKLLELMSK